jgi:hypothetical protein
MLKFICNKHDVDTVIEQFMTEFVSMVKHCKLQSIPFSHYDRDLEGKVQAVIEKSDNEFVFDREDLVGDEPYGQVMSFFECFLALLEDLKKAFPELGMEGYVFVNDLGPYECVCRQRVHTTKEMKKVEFIDQLQCVHCHKWVDISNAYRLLDDEEVEVWPCEDGDPMYPSAYFNSNCESAFCFCSEKCEQAMLDQ